MIVGVGIDLVDIERVEAILDRHGEAFMHRILHTDEVKEAPKLFLLDGHLPIAPSFLAARFAAKEAAAKSLGTGFVDGLSFQDIRVFKDSFGKPYLKFADKAKNFADELNVKNIHLSISHERKLATAIVILES